MTVSCVECGRAGSRGFAETTERVVCVNQVACLRRQVAAARRELHARGKARLPRRRGHRETGDVADGVARLIRALGRRVADEDVDALRHLQSLGGALEDAYAAGVTGLRRNYADRAIGEVLGVTRQAVEQRWPRHQSTASEEIS